jgi:cell division protein FtsW
MKLVKGGARPERRREIAPLSLEAKVLATSVGGLCLLGLPIVLSASAPAAILAGSSPWSYIVRQSIYMGLGVIVALVVSRTSLRLVRKLRLPLLVTAFCLLIVVFVPGLGHFAGGSSRWIGIGPFQLQPSELMKLALVVFAADVLARRAKRRDQWQAFVRPLFLFMAVAAVLIVKQPDLGTAIVIGCITFSMLFAAGTRLRLLVLPGTAVLAAGALVALKATYSRDRLLSFVNPFAHASTSGYQVVQSLATLGLGGVTGSGVGASITPWGFLPNAHTDFVFAVIAGNLGLVGAFAVLVGFGAFGWAGFRIAARERDPFARYVAIGVTCWILAQAVINIGGVVDALPVTGIPLPFISYGGSSLVVALIGVGLLFGIARRQPAAGAR